MISRVVFNKIFLKHTKSIKTAHNETQALALLDK